MENKKYVEVVEYTDPVCTWCWGSEPVLRKLETRFKDQLKVKFVMGGLVKDIGDFYDSFNDIGGDAETSNTQVAAHWLEASLKHGMPVKSEGFSLFSKEHPSTYPQNIAYKAAQMEDQNLADKFMRRIREATATEAKQTNKLSVLIELAADVGLDIAKFIERFSNGSAEAAFEDDLRVMHSYGVRGFPTFLVKYGEQEILMRGYQSFDALKAVINSIAGDNINEIIPEKSEDSVLQFINKYDRVAPVEIQSAFDYSEKELESLIKNLVSKDLIKTIPAGNGMFIESINNNPLFCDSDTQVCNV